MNIGIDLDGTIYLSEQLLPGAKSAINRINKKHNIFFLTNNASSVPVSILNKVNSLLGINFDITQIVTPLLVSVHYFNNINKSIYVHANSEVKNYLKSFNLMLNDNLENSEIALIGRFDSLDSKLINRFVNFYRSGGVIYTFNKDLTYPTDKGFVPGNGAIIKEIEKIIRVEIDSLGKPDQIFIDYLKHNSMNLDYVVGDRIDTDIELGRLINAHCVLVETGVYNKSHDISGYPSVTVYKDINTFSNSL